MKVINYIPKEIYYDVLSLNLEHYNDIIDFFIQELKSNIQGTFFVYQFGKIRTPGISDIDLMVVVEDSYWKQTNSIIHHLLKKNIYRYFFTHPPLIISCSLLEYLDFFHTINEIKLLYGKKDIYLDYRKNLDFNSKLMQYMVWNSFMRVAAGMEMTDKVIGVRRVLILLHNLLSSVYFGNSMLEKPINLKLQTELIREDILSAKLFNMEEMLVSYIKQVISVLNNIDSLLQKHLFPDFITSGYIKLNNDSIIIPESFTGYRHETNIFILPDFLLYLSNLFFKEIPNTSLVFKNLDNTNRFSSEVFINSFVKVIDICKQNNINFDLVLPFCARLTTKQSLLKKLIHLINYENSSY